MPEEARVDPAILVLDEDLRLTSLSASPSEPPRPGLGFQRGHAQLRERALSS